MQQKNTNPFIQWWMTPKFPLIHLTDNTGFIKKWFFHPIKRRIARWYLKLLKNLTGIKVIAITGSAGKTTTKEMLASILKQDGLTVYSKENIDPVYNIPSTILRTPIGAKYLILEMGVEYPGEMDFYLWLANPDIGIITNIFPTHLEFLENIEGVLKEKSELVLRLEKGDTAILNSDDKLLMGLAPKIKAKIVWFKSGDGQESGNSAAAVSAATSLNVDQYKISKGLDLYEKPKHRLSLITLGNGAVILDDSYNSNPEALSATLKYFVKIAGKNKKIAVLGDMKELGEFEEKFHRKLGQEISKLHFDGVIGVGTAINYLTDEIKSGTKTFTVQRREDVMPVLKPFLKKGNYILIKGSRSIGLDKLVDGLV